MNEKLTIEQTPDKETELITFFESRGYENIQLTPHRGRNDILQATKDGQKCFIKKFNPYDRSSENNIEKANNERLCYENLPKDMLIDVVEINTDEGYLVLKNVEFDETVEDEEYIKELADFELHRLPNIDASFLPKVTWENYERLFKKLRSLEEEEDVINDADSIIRIFESKHDLIMNAKKIFSQQDFNSSNLKKVDGQLKFFDFEDPKQDNAMMDMATMSIDIRSKTKLAAAYQEKIQSNELYNEELFNLMTIRRAVIVMYARTEEINSDTISEFPQNNLNAFHEAVNKLTS